MGHSYQQLLVDNARLQCKVAKSLLSDARFRYNSLLTVPVLPLTQRGHGSAAAAGDAMASKAGSRLTNPMLEQLCIWFSISMYVIALFYNLLGMVLALIFWSSPLSWTFLALQVRVAAACDLVLPGLMASQEIALSADPAGGTCSLAPGTRARIWAQAHSVLIRIRSRILSCYNACRSP